MEPIHGIQNVQKERWDLLCCVCKQRCGAKVQCESCFTAYHPLCGRIAGFHLEAADAADGGDPRFATYCGRHRKPRPELSGTLAAPRTASSRQTCLQAPTLIQLGRFAAWFAGCPPQDGFGAKPVGLLIEREDY
jgi:hypothetical protein